jgi:hypothetical protein
MADWFLTATTPIGFSDSHWLRAAPGAYNQLNVNTFGIAIRFRMTSLSESGYLFVTPHAHISIDTSGNITASVRTSSASGFAAYSRTTSVSPVSLGVWNTVVLAKTVLGDPNPSRLYLNGVDIGSVWDSTVGIPATPPNYELSIKSRGWTTSGLMGPLPGSLPTNQSFCGDLNDVAVWRNTSLSAADALSLHGAASGTWASVVASPTDYWDWDNQNTTDSGSFGAVTSTWRGFFPQLQGTDVSLYGTDDFAVSPVNPEVFRYQTAYSQVFTAYNGGAGPYTWSISAGSLPPGITLGASSTSTVTVSGTTTAIGLTYNFTIQVQEGLSTGTQAYSMTVNPGLILVSAIPPGAVNPPFGTPPPPAVAPYSFALVATGGTGPTSWSQSGTLPTGITFDALTGTFSGTPTNWLTTSSITVTATREGGNWSSGTVTYGIPFDQFNPNSHDYFYISQYKTEFSPGDTYDTPATTYALPNGAVGVPYSEPVFVAVLLEDVVYRSGLLDNYGSLPPGLSVTGFISSWTISGTPTTPGTYTFAFYYVGLSGDPIESGYQIYSITVPASPLDVIEPDFLDSDALVYSPTVLADSAILPDFLDSDAVVYSPAILVTAILAPDFLDSDAVVYSPSLLVFVQPDFLDSDAVVYEPSIAGTFVQPTFLDSTGWVAPPNISTTAVIYRDRFLTQRGPLVKDWGDWTPATPQDVTVTVNGVEVAVASVNPYHGEIVLASPIAANDPAIDVRVDYQWFPTPIMGLRLNVRGLGLNKADHRRGLGKNSSTPSLTYGSNLLGQGYQSTPANGDQIQTPTNPKGAVRTSRFPMTVVIGGPLVRPKPLLIGHRYTGFQKGYSAVLNSPTSLRLNNSPNRVAKPGFTRNPQGEVSAYEGEVTPSNDWFEEGDDSGYVNLNQGTYTLIDAQSGAFLPTSPKTAFYWRRIDLSFPASVYVVGRFQIESSGYPFSSTDTNILSPDGVFTGVGFGIHNQLRMWFAGALVINGLKHVGLLVDSSRPDLVTSWNVGPSSTAVIQSRTSMSVITAQVPMDIRPGHRFQVLTGTQAGVYTATQVVRQTDGTTTFTTSPAFPADWKRYGNQYPQVIWETHWDKSLVTYRLEVAPEQNLASLKISGSTTGTVATLTTAVSMPDPASATFLFPTGDNDPPRSLSSDPTKGQVFWGSFSPRATSRSKWSFFRYGVVPAFHTLRSSSQTVAAEMDILPDEETYNPWFVTEDFGYAVASGNLLLKSTSQHPDLEFTYGYERTEPFLLPSAYLDAQISLSVESGVLGTGDAQVIVQDTQRKVVLSTLLFIEQGTGLNYRRLIDLPCVSLNGTFTPDFQDWLYTGSSTLTSETRGPVLHVEQGDGGLFYNDVDLSGLSYVPSEGRIFEARFAVLSYTASGNETSIRVRAEVDGRVIQIRLWAGVSPAVHLLDETGAIVQAYSFDWTDEEPHTYRVVADADGNTVSLSIDDTLQAPTLALTAFASGAGNTQIAFGLTSPAINSTDSVTEWYSVSYQVMPPSTARRTLGIYKGGDSEEDYNNINFWEIPRTDTSTAPNSAQTGPVVEEMDWRSPMEIRLFRSPTWGVTLYRPDLPLPPYYDPEVYGIPGTGFATQTTEPSAGWINVETANLPRASNLFGSISFGALDSRSLTQQRWDWVRYRLYRPATASHIAPQGMVLNRANVVSSGDIYRDIHLETVTVPVIDSKSVSIWTAHQKAEEVFKILDGTTAYVRDAWTFDKTTQVVTLKTASFVSDEVTVIFVPGRPSTTTYLRNQPVLDGMTRLNEGTPPVPKNQTIKHFREQSLMDNPTDVPGRSTVPAYSPNDPAGIPNSTAYAAADTNTLADFTVPASVLYEKMTFIEVPDDGEQGLIALATDYDDLLPQGFSGYESIGGDPIYDSIGASIGAVGRATGARVLAMGGTWTLEQNVLYRPPYDQGGGLPGSFFILGGGSYLGPVVNNAGQVTGAASLGSVLGTSNLLYPSHPTTPQTLWSGQLAYDDSYGLVDDELIAVDYSFELLPGASATFTHAFPYPPIPSVWKDVGGIWVDATGTYNLSHNLTFTSITITNTTAFTLTYYVHLY